MTLLHPPGWNVTVLRDRSRFLTVWAIGTETVEDEGEKWRCGELEIVPDPVPDFPCEWPVARLGEGGTLLLWWDDGFDWTRNPEWGEHLAIGGRPAIRRIELPGPCASIGGEATVTVAVIDPAGGSWVFVACLHGPELERSRLALTEVLASIRFR